MHHISKKFIDSLKWNTLESFYFQGVFLIHQLLLFTVTTAHFYGLVGTLFSLIYLIIAVTNFGLDSSLGPFFSLCSAQRKFFKKVLLAQLIPEMVIFLGVSLALYGLLRFLPHFFPTFAYLDKTLIWLLGLLIFLEGMKKTARSILHLAFLQKKVAYLEMATITAYTATVWSFYCAGYPLTLHLIFLPMLVTSCFTSIVYFYYVYSWYCTLPETSTRVLPGNITSRIMLNRVFNYSNQLSHLVFSGNFLVPFFAYNFGLSYAGIFKLVTTLASTISIFIQKIFGLSADALLAHVKEMDLAQKQDAFRVITHYLYQAIYGITIFLVINSKKILFLRGSTFASGDTSLDGVLPLVALFFGIHVAEHFFLVYEKFFIMQEKAHYLFAFNLLVMGTLYTAIYLLAHASPFIIMSTIFAIRATAFVLLGSFSFYFWRIKPDMRIDKRFLFFSCVTSCICFFALG